jgi:hypothetical protein
MAQPNLGKRREHMVRVPEPVDVSELAARSGYSTVSRYVADLLCDKADRSDLKVGPDLVKEGQLPLTA